MLWKIFSKRTLPVRFEVYDMLQRATEGGEHMGPAERRQAILELLCWNKRDTCKRLAAEFEVSERTIRRDIAVLVCIYPIETSRGHDGGVWIADDYPRHRHHRRYLTPKQVNLLTGFRGQLAGDKLDTLNSILLQFAP